MPVQLQALLQLPATAAAELTVTVAEQTLTVAEQTVAWRQAEWRLCLLWWSELYLLAWCCLLLQGQ